MGEHKTLGTSRELVAVLIRPWLLVASGFVFSGTIETVNHIMSWPGMLEE